MLIFEYLVISKSKLFDKKYYLDTYPDVKKLGINPIYHYIKYGWKENRNPSKEFNTSYYLNKYSDINNSAINPLYHYIKYGNNEGRKCFSFSNDLISNDKKQVDSDYNQIKMPEWVIEEMKNLGKYIDPLIYPSDEKLNMYSYYSYPVHKKPGLIYQEILELCSSTHYNYCFALPWLKRGGADFVALQHINFTSKLKNNKILVLLTEPGDSPWLERLPENIDVIDVSKYIWELSHDDLLSVLTKLLIQIKIDVIHIINSRHLWEIVKRHGLALRSQSKIFASLYCDDYDKYEQPVGYARDFLPVCYKHLTKVFSDNESFPELLSSIYGYPESLFQVLKSPIEFNFSSERNLILTKNILWAGRLDVQKRPDLLLKIAKELQDVTFTVYGEPLLESQKEIVEDLKKQENIEMKGSFNGVESLPFNTHSIFLYTSQWDGIPTIIIAAALSGIPIVASNVGGVGEVVTLERGYCITDYENIQLYVEAIRNIFDNYQKAKNKAINSQIYVQKEHTIDKFCQDLLDTDGYIIK